MKNDYVDTAAITQVIGCIFNDTSILDETDKYSIQEDDFVEDFHKIVFGSIYNIHLSGSEVSIESIVDYLNNRPKFNAIFKTNHGIEYLTEVSQDANFGTFNYYYSRLKKFTLLRAYDQFGIDVSFLYDPNNVINIKKKQEQEDWLDNTPIVDIASVIDSRIENIKNKYLRDELGEGYQAGEGIYDLIDSLKKCPEVGAPLYGSLVNTITRGARLGKVYLRSGASGFGKTRAMIADVCNFACNEIYSERFGWIKNGASLPSLYISTEQDKSEIQTMMLAFISGVNEEHILNGTYLIDEEERVRKAGYIIKNSPLWIECVPNFSLQDIENIMKKYIKEYNVKYIVYDYIMTSLKILEEITKKSGGVKLREDNILFMLSTRLKDLANKYGIFIMTGTQLSGDWRDSDTPDQSLLRGAKSIADKIDIGEIILPVSEEDLAKIGTILENNPNFQTPNMKISVYKNRRGRYKGIFLWCYADLGICRIEPQFVTDWHGILQSIEDIKVIVDEGEAPWEK